MLFESRPLVGAAGGGMGRVQTGGHPDHFDPGPAELIQNETKPLSDAKLVTLLNERGFNVARRTVAKYRLMEGIGSAHQRGVSAVQ